MRSTVARRTVRAQDGRCMARPPSSAQLFELEGDPRSYAKVILDDSAGRIVDYSVPPGMEVKPGSRVRVPVRMRTLLGTVLEVSAQTDAQGVRPIAALVKGEVSLNAALLKLAAWMADYYCCPLETALKAVVPQVIRKSEMSHQRRQAVRLVRMPEEEDLEAIRRRAPLQAAVLEVLRDAQKPVSVALLAQQTDASHAVVRALERKGLVEVELETVQRDPFRNEEFLAQSKLSLNPEQEQVFARLCEALHPVGEQAAAPKPFLLHGVTGSGKTEIYLQAIDMVLEQGRSAIMLVPEISLSVLKCVLLPAVMRSPSSTATFPRVKGMTSGTAFEPGRRAS